MTRSLDDDVWRCVHAQNLRLDARCAPVRPDRPDGGDAGLDDVEALEGRRRSFARACLDWTERRPHVAGSLGAGVADLFFARAWVRRLPGGRALVLTSAGTAWLESELGVGRLS